MNRGPIDPYYQWLGIPQRDQPPHHYRLLGIELFESDPEIIRSAADRRLTFIRKYQLGQHSDLSQQLLDEVAEARECLLDPATRQPYDEMLDARLGGWRRSALGAARDVEQQGTVDCPDNDARFDPYYKWLGIAPWKQPHHHYQLLGLERFESDPRIIRIAADQQLAYVSKYRTGRHADHANQLLQELREAQICLLSPARKEGYDAGLRESLRPAKAISTTAILPLAPPPAPRNPWRPGKWLAAHRRAIRLSFAIGLVVMAVSLVVTLSGPDPDFGVADPEPAVASRAAHATAGAQETVVAEPLVAGTSAANAGNPSASVPGMTPSPAISGSSGARAISPAREPLPARADSAKNPIVAGVVGADALRSEVPAVSAVDDTGAVDAPSTVETGGATAGLGKAGDSAKVSDSGKVASEPGASALPLTGSLGGGARSVSRPDGITGDRETSLARVLKPGEPVDLLKRIDFKRDMIAGKWKFEHGVLVSPPKAFHARVVLPAAVPAEYMLEAVVERSRGTNRAPTRTLAFGLVTGESQALVTIDSAAATALPFQEGKSSVITCTVRTEGVQVLLDGRRIVDWTGYAGRLPLPSLWAVPDKSALFIGSDAGYRIRSLTLRPLE